jgi:glycosyltransferase involved in cell wall biosynthesis
MPVTVTHLVDAQTPEDAASLVSLLLRLAPAQHLLLGNPPAGLDIPASIPITRVPLRAGWPLLSLPALRSTLGTRPPGILHALGAHSTAAAGMLRRLGVSIPILATVADPTEARPVSRWWRTLRAGGARLEMLCASRIAQRRLIEAGVPVDATAVVRPGVDFGELRQARQSAGREELGLPVHGPVLVMPSPPSRGGGQFVGVWAVAILRQIFPEVKLLIPGRSREADRIARLLGEIYCPEAFLMTGYRYSPSRLLALADAMIVPAVADIPTGWLAWAMAGGVPIVASAIPAVTEFIADRQNGFLCRPGESHTLAIRIRTVLESPDQMRQCAEVARGQAYDVFRAQQCVDQYTNAFTSLAEGRPALTAVHDAAIAT